MMKKIWMLENYCSFTPLDIDNNRNAAVSFRKMRVILIVILVGLCALSSESCPSSLIGRPCLCKCFDDNVECQNSCNVESGCWTNCAKTDVACVRGCLNINWFSHVVKPPDRLVRNNTSFCQLSNICTCICIWI